MTKIGRTAVIWLGLILVACHQGTVLPPALPTAVPTASFPQPTHTHTPLPLLLATAVPSATPPAMSSSPTPSPHDVLVAHPTMSPSPPHPLTPSPAAPYQPQLIGLSAHGRPIVSYQFNDGPIKLIFVGGIHGGYEWNTILLAYQAVDYFTAHPEQIPDNVTLHIIPSANPDGQYLVTGQDGRFTPADIPTEMDTFPGRFNGQGVDLNRNWDCEWTATAVWRQQAVSGGAFPFSEPESRALRDFFLTQQPAVVLFWHSAANGVFAAGCPDTLPQSTELTTRYGTAAGYPVYERFAHYEVTGDAGDWLATQGIPSLAVELKNHEETDWPQNQAGMLALLAQFSNLSP